MLAGTLSAAVVNVDLQRTGDPVSVSTAGALPSGSFWNEPSGASYATPLLDSAGVVTSLTLWRSGGLLLSGYHGDALYGDGFAGRIEIHGLAPNSLYEVAVYGLASTMNEFRFEGEWLPYPASAAFPLPGPYEYHELPGTEGVDYVHGKLRTDDSGVLAMESRFGAIAGLQFGTEAVANPEPSVLMLSLLGGLMLLRRWR